MAKYTKPNYTEQWASAGNKVTPDSVKIQTGHVVEKPNYEHMNWIQNRQDVGIAYSLQMGIAEWDSATEYQYTNNSHNSYVQRNGVVYKAIQTGTNQDPLTQTAYWSIAFDDKGAAAAVQSNLTTHITDYGTLTGLTNTTTARTNLDVYSKAEAAQKNGDVVQVFNVANGTNTNEAVNKGQLDTKADLAGSVVQVFNVANGTNTNEAVNKGQLDTKADLAGSAVQVFNVANGTNTNEAVNKGQLDASSPTGAVTAFAGVTIPTGWLECNGAAVSRTTYASLFAVIGTLWGIGDGSTTFNLPETRGEFIRGYDNGRGIDSGRAFASSQTDDIKAHTHSVTGYAGVNASSGRINAGTTSGESGNSTGSTGGTETRPRNVSMMYIIKT